VKLLAAQPKTGNRRPPLEDGSGDFFNGINPQDDCAFVAFFNRCGKRNQIDEPVYQKIRIVGGAFEVSVKLLPGRKSGY
jgi:hypothetical protein